MICLVKRNDHIAQDIRNPPILDTFIQGNCSISLFYTIGKKVLLAILERQYSSVFCLCSSLLGNLKKKKKIRLETENSNFRGWHGTHSLNHKA